MKYTINDTPISLTYENTYEIYPTLKEQLESYVESRPKIKDVRVFINGLTTPIPESIGLHLTIQTDSFDRLLEVDYLDSSIHSASITHRDGTVAKLDNDTLYDISSRATISGEGFLHTALDQITIEFLDHMINQ